MNFSLRTLKLSLNQELNGDSLKFPTEELFLAACLIAGFLIRFLLIPQNGVINGDGVYYTILGERFVSGDFGAGISAYWSPLYSILTGISSLLFHDREFSGRFISLVAGSLLVIPSYLLIREFYGRISAYFGACLLVVHPFLIKSSGWVMTESLYTLIFTSCVLSGWFALLNGKTRTFFITGLLFGAAFLTKPEAIGYLGLMVILTLGTGLFSRGSNFRPYAFSSIILLLGFAVFFLPYFLYLHHKTGQWTVSQKITVNLPAADYEGELSELTQNGQMTMKDRIWGDDYETEYHPSVMPIPTPSKLLDLSRLKSDIYILGSKALTLLKKQLRDYFPSILPYPFLLVALVGFFVRPWSRIRAAKEIYLFSFVISTLIGYAASTVELRYLFPLIPILIAWVANGIVEFSEWVLKSVIELYTPTKIIRPIFVQIFTLLFLIASLVPLSRIVFAGDEIENVPFEEKRAGLWIKDHSDAATPLVMSSNITAAFYAEAKHLYLPNEELSTILEYAMLKRADYLVFSERRGREAPSFLTDKNSTLHTLKLVFQDEQNPKHEIRVYQIIY